MASPGNGRSAGAFGFDRTFAFDVPAERLWALLSDTSSFREWWPWLRAFEPVAITPGATTRCAIGPPLPYVLTVDLAVTEVVDGELVVVDVSGDLRGPARLEIAATGTGSRARLEWELELRRPILKAAARVARPVLLWGHDWVVANGVEQFRTRAITQR